MNKSILMQKQVKDNADDLQKEFLDMKNWEEQMKHKDEELKKEASGQITLPPIRSKHKNKLNKTSAKQNEKDDNNERKRIKSYDYSAWDKFDTDKACQEVDQKDQSDDSEDEHISKEELEKAHQEAIKHKNEGNILVQQQKWAKAVGCYSEAIKIFPYDAVFYANRALCQLKLDDFYSAESDCSSAIQLDETYIKAYHRRATARMNLKQYKEAKRDLEKILRLEPSNKEAQSLLNQIESKIKPPETAAEKDIKKSSEMSSIEKQIAEKLWGRTISNNVADKKDSTTVDTKDNASAVKDKKDSRIPSWLPEKDDVAVIEPIEKPPHLRSKKSLTKIPIQEVEFNSTKYKCDYSKDKAESCRNETSQADIDSKDSNIMENNSLTKISDSSGVTSLVIPPIPESVVQFMMHWRSNKSLEFRYKYLKQFPRNSLSEIFQDSMEPDIFSQILEVLKLKFVKAKDPIFSYLKDLSEVKRFKVLIIFITSSDKESLRILFEHCKIVENVSEDEVTALKNKYEI